MNANTLVLGPGGTKGYAELGQLQYLEMTDRLKDIVYYGGVSVGAVIALLLSVGFKTMEIVNYAQTTNLLDTGNLLSPREMFQQQGFFCQRTFEEKFDKIIGARFGFIPTLQQLFELTGKEYMAVVTNVSAKIPFPEYLTRHTHPELSCVKAALMSSNIPAVFTKCRYRDAYYVDGGLSNPYPIDHYRGDEHRILGLTIIALPGTDNAVGYLLQCIQASMLQIRERVLIECRSIDTRCTHLVTYVGVNSSGSFIVNDQEKKAMFMEGFAQTRNYYESGNGGVYQEGNGEVVYDT